MLLEFLLHVRYCGEYLCQYVLCAHVCSPEVNIGGLSLSFPTLFFEISLPQNLELASQDTLPMMADRQVDDQGLAVCPA